MTRHAPYRIAVLATLAAACGASGAGDDGGHVGFGGAQDIGQFRGILDTGGIPGEETLDANGFFNEHYSTLPPATCGQALCLAPMLSIGRAWLSGAYQATLQIAMTTPIDPQSLPRLPMDLVVVVDRSGSMVEDGRLEKVQAGLHLLVDALAPGDRIALVQFDDVVDTLTTFDDAPTAAELHALIDDMYPRGATDIYDGLAAGIELAASAYTPERQSRLILLSDGLATAGILDPAAIVGLADEQVRHGTSLSTIGVGLEFDVELMRGLAEHGAGTFYFLEDAAAVDEVFTQELDTALTPIALDLRVDAVPAAGYQLGEVIGTRVWSSTSDGGEARIPAVFVASRQSQTPDPGRRGGGGSIFIDLTPIAGAIGEGRVATVHLTYHLPGQTEPITQTVDVFDPGAPGELPEATYVSVQAMMEHYAAYNLYLGLRAATQMAAYSYDCAYAALGALTDSATRWNSVYQDPDVTADLALVAQFRANLREHGAVDDPSLTQGACLDPDGAPDPGYDGYTGLACAAGGGRSGLASLVVIGAALAFARRRRR